MQGDERGLPLIPKGSAERDHGLIEPSASDEIPQPAALPRPTSEANGPPWAPYPEANSRHWRHDRAWREGRADRWGRHRRGPWDHGLRRPRPLRRSHGDRMLGGVAGGLADWIGIDATVVRLGFVLAVIFSGFGIAAYIVLWMAIPVEGERASIATKAMRDWRGIALALSLLPLVVLGVILGVALGAPWLGAAAVPLCVGFAGVILIWRNVGDGERTLVARVVRPMAKIGVTGNGSWKVLAVRSVIGVILVSAGAATLVLGSNQAVLRPLGGAALVVAGAVVVFGPWWLHVVRDLVDERQARALAEERADMAARLHDSVLQTLALIQRRADQPQQVMKLARAQERELRSWLFDGKVPGPAERDDASLAEAVHRIERDVEELHEVSVEAVVVGDCALDDDLHSLVDAGREATVNAAKWSGSPVVALFVEVEPDEVSMFVRDRGSGFDASQVALDRRGVAESILGRMERHGGSAEVRSAPGSGTEVVLRMPRHGARTP